jgi:hypothetical protein
VKNTRVFYFSFTVSLCFLMPQFIDCHYSKLHY